MMFAKSFDKVLLVPDFGRGNFGREFDLPGRFARRAGEAGTLP